MNILIVNFNDLKGGAAIASYRLHKKLNKLGHNSKMLVYRKFSKDEEVIGPKNILVKFYRIIRQHLGKIPNYFFKRNIEVLNSGSFLSTSFAKYINKSDCEIVHLNWINFDFLSIKDISEINKPIVWTLHDMWAFCGAEHLSYNSQYITGYKKKLLLNGFLNFDLNSIVFEKKNRLWKKPINIVTPSNWLADCARKSILMKDWPISVIPNSIDVNQWKLYNKSEIRELFNLNQTKKIILFSTSEPLGNYNKGFELLSSSLELIEDNNFLLMIIGAQENKKFNNVAFEVRFFGSIKSQNILNQLYCCADVVVVPSRQESLSYVAIESICSSVPVVAYDNSGIKDVIQHMFNGYLAKPFEVKDFAHGINLILNDNKLRNILSLNARKFAKKTFDESKIARQYLKTYQNIINSQI